MARTTVPPQDMPLEEFQKHVRNVALKVQKRQGWADEGLNDVLRTLGLKEKKVIRVPVEVTMVRRGTVVFTDVDSEQEAFTRAAAMSASDLIEAGAFKALGGYQGHRALTVDELASNDEFALLQRGDTTTAVRDERDANPGTDYCGQYGPGREWVCSRTRDHLGTHVAMTGREVLEVWQEGEGGTRR